MRHSAAVAPRIYSLSWIALQAALAFQLSLYAVSSPLSVKDSIPVAVDCKLFPSTVFDVMASASEFLLLLTVFIKLTR